MWRYGWSIIYEYIDGLVQDRSNSSVLKMDKVS